MAKTEDKYIGAVGRRKTSVARVRITPASKNEIIINGKKVSDYFPTDSLRKIAREALGHGEKTYSVSVKVTGGGIASQAEAVRHGMARAMAKDVPEVRTAVKKAGFLSRDQRAKERRKFGLKKARKAPQWSKR